MPALVYPDEWTDGAPTELESGMLVLTSEGSEFLVGDVNPSGGECDCCARIRSNEVVAYKVPVVVLTPGGVK